MPPVHSKPLEPSAKREILIHLILSYGRGTGTLKDFLANQDNIVQANLTQVPSVKANQLKGMVAEASKRETKRLFNEARLEFRKGTESSVIESKIRSKLFLPKVNLKAALLISQSHFAVPILVPAPRNPKKAATAAAGYNENADLLGSTPYIFPLDELDEWKNTFYCWIQAAQTALFEGDLSLFHHITRHAVGDLNEIFTLLHASKGRPTQKIEKMVRAFADKMRTTVARDDIAGTLIQTKSKLSSYSRFKCGYQENLVTVNQKMLDLEEFQQMTNFLVKTLDVDRCYQCLNEVEKRNVFYEIEGNSFAVAGSATYPDLALALNLYYPAVLTLTNKKFYWSFAIVKEMNDDSSVPVKGFVIKIGDKGCLVKVTGTGEKKFEQHFQSNSIIGYVVEALFYSTKKPRHLHHLQSTGPFPIPRPKIVSAKTVALRLQPSPSPPPVLKIRTQDLVIDGKKALKHPNEVKPWNEMLNKDDLAVCWMNSNLHIIQYAVKKGDAYYWLLCRDATEEVLALAETIRARNGDPSRLSFKQRQVAAQTYMETPNQSTKLFFTCGMRTRTLFDVIMKCKDKNCKLEESVLKKDTCNFDTPLFLHCIGLESSIKCVSACAGCKENTRKQLVLVIEGEGFVVEGAKDDTTGKAFTDLDSIAKVYPEWVKLDGRSYYRHIMRIVVFYKDADYAHSFNILIDQLGGPLRMVCDSETSVWEADTDFTKEQTHGFHVTNAFYASQKLG